MIPDLVPAEDLSRFAGVKALLEVPIAILVFRFAITPLIEGGSIFGGLMVLMVLVVLVMGVTLFAPEPPAEGTTKPLDWQPFVRLVLMTAFFILVILGLREVAVWATRSFVSLVASPEALAGVNSVAALADRVSLPLLLGGVGFIGLLAMSAAVIVGVWGGVRISIGGDGDERNRSFTWWVISRLAFLVSTTNLSSFAVYFVQGRLGYEGDEAAGPAGQLILFLGIALLISALLSGWLTSRLGLKRAVALCGIVGAVGTLVMIMLPSLPLIYLGGSIIGLATGVFYTASWALGTSLVPQEEAGRYLGLANLAGAGAGAVGAYIGGPVADYFTVYVPGVPGLGYVMIFVVYGLLFLLSVVTLSRVEYPLGEGGL